MQLRLLAVHRVPHVATEEEWRAPGRSLGSRRLSEVPLFHRHPRAAPRRALLPAPRARCKAPRPPASRRGAGGDREEEAAAKGKEEEEEEEGTAESDAMGGRLIPSAPGGPLSQPAAAASCWELQRLSAPTTGVRAADAPTSCHPAPTQAPGTWTARAGAAKAFNTCERASLGF